MTTMQQTDVQCPVCKHEIHAQWATATYRHGMRTDLHVRAQGTQPLPYRVITCNDCGFSAEKAVYDAQADDPISDYARFQVQKIITPLLLQGSGVRAADPMEKWEWAAVIADWSEREAKVIAQYWLNAAWCAVDEGDVEAERYYRLKAVRLFMLALDRYDDFKPEERAKYVYLVGELWRRIGDLKQATYWFEQVQAEAWTQEDREWVALADQQRTCPREWRS